MKKINFSINWLLTLLVFSVISCKNDDEVKPSSEPSAEKSIISFKLAALSPEVIGTINETSKTVNLVAPAGTEITALSPTITISAKAKITPASGEAQDFTEPVVYTVTAENGTKSEYTVAVTVEKVAGPPISIDPHVGFLEVAQDEFLFIYGENFGTDASKVKVILESTTSSTVIELDPFEVLFESTRIVVRVPADAPLEDYKVKVVVDEQSLYMEETFTVVYHRPSISSISPSTITRGENFILTGEYFAASGNIVEITIGSESTSLSIVNESTTSIEVTVPSTQDPGEYTIKVTSNGKVGYYSSEKLTVNKPSTSPEIFSISQSSYKVGEVLTITGKNFKKVGYAANINFMPFIEDGPTIIKSAVSNAEGTELIYTIPDDFPSGTYLISVEVDFEWSDDYGDVIKITK